MRLKCLCNIAKNACVFFRGLEPVTSQGVSLSIASRFIVFPTTLPVVELLGDFIRWKMFSDDEPSSNASSLSGVESLQSVGEGEGSLNSPDRSARSNRIYMQRERTRRDGGK